MKSAKKNMMNGEELNTYQRHAKVPSQKLSDYLVQALFDKKKKEKKNLTDIQFFTSENQ